MENKFIAKVSKGSRYYQIYLPKEAEIAFKPGDKVEIKHIEPKLYYHGKKELSKFKTYLIKEIFSRVLSFKEVSNAAIFGSFLTERVYYRDIDVLVILKKKVNSEFEEKLHNTLTAELNQDFHLLIYDEKDFSNILKTDPLTRSMLTNYVAYNKIKVPSAEIDKNHINFLLMMPQDLLKIELSSRIYYDNLRRLLTIRNFLQNKTINQISINEELINDLNNEIIKKSKEDKILTTEELNLIKNFMEKEIILINKLLKEDDGQKTRN